MFWKVTLIFLYIKMTLKDYFHLAVEKRFDGNKTRGKESSFKLVVESRTRDNLW